MHSAGGQVCLDEGVLIVIVLVLLAVLLILKIAGRR